MRFSELLPRSDTQSYMLLELTAICGEFPADLLSRLPGSDSYKMTIIWALKRDKLLKTYYKDRLRGYRLGTKAKAALLEANPKRFSFYLTGNADTNMLKSEFSRRLRLHRLAEIYLLMQKSGITIFRDEKPQIFSPEGSAVETIAFPAFYSSREIKELGLEAIKIRSSRMMGVVLAQSGIFLTYNSGSSTAKWDYRAEQRTKSLLEILLCRQRLSHQYACHSISGLLVGHGMEPVFQLLTSADSGTRCFFLLDGNYEHFYYLTNDHHGEVLLRLLCCPEKTAALNRTLSLDLSPKKTDWSIENDGFDNQGNAILFGYFFDIPRINRFCSALQIQERTGTIICFDFQSEVLFRCFGNRISLQTISFEKFEGRFFHQ